MSDPPAGGARWKPAPPERRGRPRLRPLLLAALLVAPPLGIALGRAAPPCALHSLTSVPCPGCGLGTAAAALARGEPVAALRAYPPLATLAVLHLVLLVTCLASLLGRQPGRVAARLTGAVALLTAVSLLGNWLLRLLEIKGGSA